MNNLKPGFYELSEDVANPKPDRRYNTWDLSNWPYIPVIPKGTRFVVAHVNTIDWEDHPADPPLEIRNLDGRFSKSIGEYFRNEGGLFQLVAAKLVPTKRTLKTFLVEHHWELHNAEVILSELINNGKVMYEDVGEAIKVVEARWESED